MRVINFIFSKFGKGQDEAKSRIINGFDVSINSSADHLEIESKCMLKPSGFYGIRVVGVQYCKDDIDSIVLNTNGNNVLVYCTAKLTRYINEHDCNAVEVSVGGKRVGHLSRQDAMKFKEQIKSHKLSDVNIFCNAVISAGGRVERNNKTIEDRYEYVIELDFDVEDVFPLDTCIETFPIPLFKTYDLKVVKISKDEIFLEREHMRSNLLDFCNRNKGVDCWVSDEHRNILFVVDGTLGPSGIIGGIGKDAYPFLEDMIAKAKYSSIYRLVGRKVLIRLGLSPSSAESYIYKDRVRVLFINISQKIDCLDVSWCESVVDGLGYSIEEGAMSSIAISAENIGVKGRWSDRLISSLILCDVIVAIDYKFHAKLLLDITEVDVFDLKVIACPVAGSKKYGSLEKLVEGYALLESSLDVCNMLRNNLITPTGKTKRSKSHLRALLVEPVNYLDPL